MPLELSFEFFPPKTEVGLDKLLSTAEALSAFNPTFFSVTYGAGGSTRDKTLAAVSTLNQANFAPVAPHISAIGSYKADVDQLLQTYQAQGIRQLVVLRGDHVSGMPTSAGEFRYANELLQYIRATTGSYFRTAIAAYPEFHPEAGCSLTDFHYFKQKASFADMAITQYFFNPDSYFYFVDLCRQHHITIPIIPGIMPIGSLEKLQRFSNLCGAEIPRWLAQRMQSLQHDEHAMIEFGVEVVAKLCEKLIAGGCPGLHFYTLNSATITSRICNALGFKVAEAQLVE